MKKGISLIVLVITIIVMIIIAGAIILSLNSSNVTGRANLSTLSSDRANFKAEFAVCLGNAMAELDTEELPVTQEAAFELAVNGTYTSAGKTATIANDMKDHKAWDLTAGSSSTLGSATFTDTRGVVWTITSDGEVTATVADISAYSLEDGDIASGATYAWVKKAQ